MRRVLVLAALAMALPGQAGWAAGQFDGRYVGPRTLLRGAPPTCSAEGDATWTITDSHMSIRVGNVPVATNIGADGSFRSETPYQVTGNRTNATIVVAGRIASGGLEADLETFACKQHYSLKKR